MINVNLLPKDLRRSTGPDFWKVGAGALAGVTLLTIAILQFSVSSTLNTLEGKIQENQSEIAVLRPQVDERNRLLAEKNQLTAITSVAETLKAGQTSWSGDLARFVRQLPRASAPVVALNSLTMKTLDAGGRQSAQQNGLYDGKAVTKEVQVSGKARSSAGLVQFVNAFEQAPDFGVQFQNMQREQEGGLYTFSVTVGMVGTPPPQAAAQGQAPGPTGAAIPVSTTASGGSR